MNVQDFNGLVVAIEDAVEETFLEGVDAVKKACVNTLKDGDTRLFAATYEDEQKEDICNKIRNLKLSASEIEASLKIIFPEDF